MDPPMLVVRQHLTPGVEYRRTQVRYGVSKHCGIVSCLDSTYFRAWLCDQPSSRSRGTAAWQASDEIATREARSRWPVRFALKAVSPAPAPYGIPAVQRQTRIAFRSPYPKLIFHLRVFSAL